MVSAAVARPRMVGSLLRRTEDDQQDQHAAQYLQAQPHNGAQRLHLPSVHFRIGHQALRQSIAKHHGNEDEDDP